MYERSFNSRFNSQKYILQQSSSEQMDHGYCNRLDAHGLFSGRIKMWDIHSIAFIFSSVALAIWARHQYAMSTTGYFLGRAMVIFPIHMKILLALGATSLAQGLMTIIPSIVVHDHDSTSDKVMDLILNTLSYSSAHFVIGELPSIGCLVVSANVHERNSHLRPPSSSSCVAFHRPHWGGCAGQQNKLTPLILCRRGHHSTPSLEWRRAESN